MTPETTIPVMTFEQLVKELERQDLEPQIFINGEDEDGEEIANPLVNIGEWEIVDTGDYGVKKEDAEFVTYFPSHNIYILSEGYYSSYEGDTYVEGWGKEVFPKEITITVYKEKELAAV